MKVDEMTLADMLSINPNDHTTEELREVVKCLALLLAERVGVAEVLNIINGVKERE